MMENRSKMRFSFIVALFILQSHILPFTHSKAIVKKLPGFSGELPFTIETGYVGVGKDEEVQLFYYFAESQRNPQKDPLLLYLSGGPGNSGLIAFLYQIGPLKFEYANARRTKVNLEVNPYSWTKTANIIFIDLPVGTGFSYSKTYKSSGSNDSLVIIHAYDFITKWVVDHPKFLTSPLYIAGASYMGLIIPNVVSNIYNGNEQRVQPKLNIKGFLLVSPLTDRFIDFNSRVEFAYRAALIEDEIYECIARINMDDILEPLCDEQDPKSICPESIYLYSNTWANTKAVREALHIRDGTVDIWQYRNTTIRGRSGKIDPRIYSQNLFSSLATHKHLVTKNCHGLIINGDHDMTFPYMGVELWINSLELKTVNPWRPWFVNSQVAGYQKNYSKDKYSLRYATIKGAGHTVALNKPEEAQALVEAWLASHTNSTKS
ncbi:hypothetical protein LXL04_010885 [Taraxacum kok-saghyz]